MTFVDHVYKQADLLKELARQNKIESFVSLPAVVTEDYDSIRNSVTIKPLIKRAIPSADGGYEEESLPVVYDAPMMVCGFGEYSISFPINIGDECLILITDYDIQSWRVSGQESHPGDTRMHDLSNATILFGLKKLSSPNSKYNQSGIVIGSDSGIRVTITASQMQVGGDADSAALATKVDQIYNVLNSHLDNWNTFVSSIFPLHNHPGVTTGAGVSGVPLINGTSSSEYTGGPTASTMLKVGG